MGLFSKLKAAVGIGNPKIQCLLESNQVYRGDTIKGTIELKGTSGEVPVAGFIIELVEVVTQTRWNANTKREEDYKVDQVVARNLIPMNGQVIKADEVISKEFEVLISPNSKISSFPVAHILGVSADIPGLDSRAQQEIFII